MNNIIDMLNNCFLTKFNRLARNAVETKLMIYREKKNDNPIHFNCNRVFEKNP